jgi:hypothetical protein
MTRARTKMGTCHLLGGAFLAHAMRLRGAILGDVPRTISPIDLDAGSAARA